MISPPYDGEIVEEVGEYKDCGHEAKVYKGRLTALVSLEKINLVLAPFLLVFFGELPLKYQSTALPSRRRK